MTPVRAEPQDNPSRSLRKTPGFRALFWCQFLGALNDNIFKSALLVIIAFRFVDQPGEVAQLNNFAAALLILPFLLASPLAGQLADRGEKSRMIRLIKIAELLICLAGTLALALGSLPLMLSVIFALGLQSAFFGPNKYAVLPQLLPDELLVKGNAQIASATFVAILLGAFLGGILANAEITWLWVGGGTVLVAIAGLLAARRLPQLEVADPGLKLDLNPVREAISGLRYARNQPQIWMALIGISWFWFLGSAYLTQLPALARFSLGGDELLVSQLILVFILGICGGAYLCSRLSGRNPELGTVPLALLLVSVVSLHLGISQMSAASEFVSGRLLAGLDIHLLGWAGGLVGVPLYATLQRQTDLFNRARIIAVNNIANAVFMICSALLGMVVLGVFQQSLSAFFILISALNLLVALWFIGKLMRPMLRLLAQMAAALHYRIQVEGLDNIPAKGPALLVCNHVSYADAVLLMAAIPRPMRFVMTRNIYEKPWLKWILRAAGCIPLSAPLQDRSGFQSAFAEAAASLRQGELVFIFPEGRLTPDGQLQPFKRGVEKIIEQAPVEVVPLAIQGMWGSFFSHGNGPVFRKWPQSLRRTIKISAGAPLDAPSAAALGEEVRKLLSRD